MKSYATVPFTMAPPGGIRQPRTTCQGLDARRSGLARFRRFIETTDWERRYLCHSGIDKACRGILLVALLYFAPLLGSILLR